MDSGSGKRGSSSPSCMTDDKKVKGKERQVQYQQKQRDAKKTQSFLLLSKHGRRHSFPVHPIGPNAIEQA